MRTKEQILKGDNPNNVYKMSHFDYEENYIERRGLYSSSFYVKYHEELIVLLSWADRSRLIEVLIQDLLVEIMCFSHLR